MESSSDRGDAEFVLREAYAAQKAGDTPRAAALYEQVIALSPGRPEAYVNLGQIRLNAGDQAAAERLFRRAIEIAPDTALAHLNLGVVHVHRRAEEDAMRAFQRALQLNPNMAPALLNLAGVYERMGRLPDAACQLDRLVMILPSDITAHMARAHVLFMLGRWKEAWTSYRKRHEIFWGAGRKLPGRPWHGEEAAGKTVLLSFEQGLGEQIMFASMVPEIARRAKRVILECEERLVVLFERSFPEVEVVPWGEKWHPRVSQPDIDLHAALGDPGLWLRDGARRFPLHGGYLRPDPGRVAALRKRYEALARGRRIAGLSWHSAAVPFGPHKSIPEGSLAPFLAREDIFWVNLQHGPARYDVGPAVWRDDEVDPSRDFDAFAAQIAALDIVVSASNATAHLAGALGKSTVVLLPKVLGRHWYWFPDQTPNLWYPSVRTFVQSREGAWDDVVVRAAAAL